MYSITTSRHFTDTGSYQREKEDLSYYIFKDLNFSDSKRHISFYRSDFRGSKFINVNFYRNNLDRADFISCALKKSSFISVDFGGCEVKNCYFDNVNFERNKYDAMAIQQSTFIDCNFYNEHFMITMYDCKFIRCTFTDCSFDESSTEKLEFVNCKISNTNFATMHAECHTFISCELNNVCLDTSYVFSYFFYNTNLDSIDFLSRGEVVHLRALNNLYKRLLGETRYFEFTLIHLTKVTTRCIFLV